MQQFNQRVKIYLNENKNKNGWILTIKKYERFEANSSSREHSFWS